VSERLLVLGEAVVDLVVGSTVDPDAGAAVPLTVRAHPGGSPANVAVAAAWLGVPTALAARISRHGFGPWLRSHLVASGVDVRACVDADEPCSLAVVTTDADGTPSYAFYVEGAADYAWRDDELPDVRTLGATVVHTGSLAVALDPGRDVVGAWLARVRTSSDAFVSFDPNVREATAEAGRVDALVRHAHLVKLSDGDLAALRPGADAAGVASRWLAAGPELVVVTHGAGGATAFLRGGRVVERRAPRVEVVDTVGAGDAFTAGLLRALAERGVLHRGALATLAEADVAAALDGANEVAALSCARPGGGSAAPVSPRRSPRAC
jgi:fructokinase